MDIKKEGRKAWSTGREEVGVGCTVQYCKS